MNWKMRISFYGPGEAVVIVAPTKDECLMRANNVAVERLRILGGAPVSFIRATSIEPTDDPVNDIGVTP